MPPDRTAPSLGGSMISGGSVPSFHVFKHITQKIGKSRKMGN